MGIFDIEEPLTPKTLRRLGFIEGNNYWFKFLRLKDKDFRYSYYPDTHYLYIQCYAKFSYMPDEPYEIHTELEMYICMDWEFVKDKLKIMYIF